jgi:hypothetical protein
MAEEIPVAAFILSLIGAILILINGLAVAAAGAFMIWIPIAGAAIILIGLGLSVPVMMGAILMYSKDKSRVMTGSIIVLIFSIISLFIGGGFIIGFILCLVGSILGLVWTPPVSAQPQPYYPQYAPPPGTQVRSSGDTITITYPGGGTQALTALLQINGRTIPVTTLPQTFGRNNFSSVVQDPSLLNFISHEHFTIGYDFAKGNFLIWDKGSKNGTYLNGVDIRGRGPQPLRSNDVISIANVLTIRFVSLGS